MHMAEEGGRDRGAATDANDSEVRFRRGRHRLHIQEGEGRAVGWAKGRAVTAGGCGSGRGGGGFGSGGGGSGRCGCSTGRTAVCRWGDFLAWLGQQLDQASERKRCATAGAEPRLRARSASLRITDKDILRGHPREYALLAKEMSTGGGDDRAVSTDDFVADWTERGGGVPLLKQEEFLETTLLDCLRIEAEALRRLQLVDIRLQLDEFRSRRVHLRCHAKRFI